ncbi:regulator of protease activity HflC (stomatin/prohibitin superfamily) [Litorivivens lipolytica]|uniref:Regulator of protease activity HflC (Stomatin/prohibitin superfamily) n=1 Tax=Litorivivens lipolytica TaxID=1524264 RepID=A0A7W4W4I8_9GAMM|nr:SPFH domain-containing protein [Litorivivens lipolytica]MBB3046739.1 regulator of protease activity HflC (stomatin/prohibitin superfamily) [Litorivivens lipolytica]
MGTIVIILIVLLAGIVFTFVAQSTNNPAQKRTFSTVSIGCYIAALITLAMASYTTVPAGHVKVASLFGKVQPTPFDEGLHFPVNPLYSWTEFDLRQKTHKETAGVPSEDKLITEMDVSVQYRTIGSMAPDILRNTGQTKDIINVHMIPKLRSILREQGKGVAQAQDFFLESVQAQLQTTLQISLSEFLAPKGLQIESVLIRDVVLPAVIRNAITETKKREQEVLKQQAELERFATEQNQKVKQAESELQAAKLEAEKIRALADAEAYQIQVINQQLAKSPNYIRLKEVERWNGVLPKYTGNSSVPILDLRKE